MMPVSRSRARRVADTLLPPNPILDPNLPNRNVWITQVCKDFVTSSDTNKQYYRVILETLWPSGHGLPGPCVRENELRTAIDDYRRKRHLLQSPGIVYKNYLDPFRRVRELLGEEGSGNGVKKAGQCYQLVNLQISAKRVPRVALSDTLWESVRNLYNDKCAVCGRVEPEVNFQRDHKIPRLRADIPGGGDGISNWQPLCTECNNFKSTSCRGCNLSCLTCSWAFPEKYAPLKISGSNIEHLRAHATASGVDPHELANEIFKQKLDSI